MDSLFGDAMGYVCLSRIQNISQLYLLSFDTTKIHADEDALVEMKKMQLSALNNPINLNKDDWNVVNGNVLKMTSLNVRHLPNRLLDLGHDPTILKSDIICLQETFSINQPLPQIPGYVCQMPSDISQGRGRGVAAFIKEGLMHNFLEATPVNENYGQYLKLCFLNYDVITVYRTQDCTTMHDNLQFVQLLKNLITDNKPTIINGDFNFDYWKEKDNFVRLTLETQGFRQLVREPTTLRGKCIDHVYIKDADVECKLLKLYYPYYTDHEAIRVIVEFK